MHLNLPFICLISFALTTILTAQSIKWGPAWSIGPTKSHIIQATTTIEPGKPPQPPKDLLVLWPGMSNSSGDLIQAVFEQYVDLSYCNATKEEWCVRASYYRTTPTPHQTFGTGVAKSTATEKIKMDYKRSADAKSWTQTVTRVSTGQVISTLTSDSGIMTGWGTGTECQNTCTGSTDYQYYTDTTIVLEAADTTFGNTRVLGTGVKEEGFTSTEGGKVWKVAKITLPPMVH